MQRNGFSQFAHLIPLYGYTLFYLVYDTANKENPKKYSKSGNCYIVSPYAMLWDSGNYFLYTYTDKGVFRIDRMEVISNPLLAERDGLDEFNTIVAPGENRSFLNSPCIQCGQCVSVCPTGALMEKSEVGKVDAAFNAGKHVMMQTTPAGQKNWVISLCWHLPYWRCCPPCLLDPSYSPH